MYVLYNRLVAPGAEFADGCRNHVEAASAAGDLEQVNARWSTVDACSMSRWRTWARARFPRMIALESCLGWAVSWSTS